MTTDMCLLKLPANLRAYEVHSYAKALFGSLPSTVMPSALASSL